MISIEFLILVMIVIGIFIASIFYFTYMFYVYDVYVREKVKGLNSSLYQAIYGVTR